MTEKIGVYVCHCGTNIAGIVDVADVAKWAAEEAPAAAETTAVTVNEEAAGTMMQVATAGSLPIMAGGFKIILKDAKIYANKVIIQTVDDKKKQ